MAAANRSNPLALAVLICLVERPMHPYEVATTLRQRDKHESVRLNYGSLYAVVDSLERRGLIAAPGTAREGRLPERTVYELTEAGRVEAHDWLTDLIATPVKEYPAFEAALSFLPALPPDDVVALLESGPAPRDRDRPGPGLPGRSWTRRAAPAVLGRGRVPTVLPRPSSTSCAG